VPALLAGEDGLEVDEVERPVAGGLPLSAQEDVDLQRFEFTLLRIRKSCLSTE
jgi:hypothetical protein